MQRSRRGCRSENYPFLVLFDISTTIDVYSKFSWAQILKGWIFDGFNFRGAKWITKIKPAKNKTYEKINPRRAVNNYARRSYQISAGNRWSRKLTTSIYAVQHTTVIVELLSWRAFFNAFSSFPSLTSAWNWASFSRNGGHQLLELRVDVERWRLNLYTVICIMLAI